MVASSHSNGCQGGMNSRAGHGQAEAEVDRLRTSIPTGRWLHFGFQIDTAVSYRAGITGETYLRGGANRKRVPPSYALHLS